DGEQYTKLGTIQLGLSNTQIGLFATKNSNNATIDTYCQYIRVLSPGAQNIVKVEPVSVTTSVGIAPKLPQYVTVIYEDGSSGTASVVWDAIDPASYAQEGTFTVRGTVSGTEIKATAEVTVIGEAVVTLKAPASVNTDDIFEVTYGLANVEKISAQDITIKYNKDLFEYVGIVLTDEETTELLQPEYNDADAGTVRFIIAHPGRGNAINGSADVVKIKFKAKTSGVGTIEASAKLGNSLGEVIVPDKDKVTVVVDTDKSLLEAAINRAQEIYSQAEEGIEVGQYPAGTKDRILKTAIIAAQAVLESDPTFEEITQAIADLNAAIEKFLSLVITEQTGDINDIPGYDIGDVGLVADYYGISEGHPDWNKIKNADINGDGEIGLFELAFIAKKIMNV
ncbi:MAG TPA: hypothetical protein GXX36_01740, partial [Clostridiaceae bacterium]|nr:hypothetical protein [Clostridiaceae bacterium]